MNSYQQEQIDALNLATTYISKLSKGQIRKLDEKIAPYLEFRHCVDTFLLDNLSQICTQSCYLNQRSACCSRDGIITFFADVLINALYSSPKQIEHLTQAIEKPKVEFKCLYLGGSGCLWQIKPIVCVMFLCEKAQQSVFSENPQTKLAWQHLKNEERRFKWPDRPVLFDWLEKCVLENGYSSSLMYFHNSPGLLRVKKHAGLI